MASEPVLRLCEWSQVQVSATTWPAERRAALDAAARAWQTAHRLNAAPLSWGGVDGCTLQARQWAGIVEIDGATVEIYPKLDAHLLAQPAPDAADAQAVLHSLLWLMEAGGYGDIVETETAALGQAPLSFVDVWAYLLAKNLRAALRLGLAHTYQAHAATRPAVRGRVLLGQQLTRHWNRCDRIACAWHEWTPDTPLNRLFKAACRALSRRTRHAIARGLLFDCLFLLDDVADVPPDAALRATARFVPARATAHFGPCLDLARRLLQGLGPLLGAGSERTFVFLVDMNQVFESFCRAALAAHFATPVQAQRPLGTLLHLRPGGIQQFADFYWQTAGRVWIADAKYKHLASRQDDALRFGAGLADDDPASPRLSPDDVRQLTVYAELERRRHGWPVPPTLLLLYPFVGTGRFAASACTAWNGSEFHLVPVKVTPQASLGKALPELQVE